MACCRPAAGRPPFGCGTGHAAPDEPRRPCYGCCCQHLQSISHPQASQTARPSTNLPRPVGSDLGICRRAVAQGRQKMGDELTAIYRPGGWVAAFPHLLPTSHVVACTFPRPSLTQMLHTRMTRVVWSSGSRSVRQRQPICRQVDLQHPPFDNLYRFRNSRFDSPSRRACQSMCMQGLRFEREDGLEKVTTARTSARTRFERISALRF